MTSPLTAHRHRPVSFSGEQGVHKQTASPPKCGLSSDTRQNHWSEHSPYLVRIIFTTLSNKKEGQKPSLQRTRRDIHRLLVGGMGFLMTSGTYSVAWSRLPPSSVHPLLMLPIPAKNLAIRSASTLRFALALGGIEHGELFIQVERRDASGGSSRDSSAE